MKDVLTIGDHELRVRISLQGGTVLDAYCSGQPVLRPYRGDEDGPFDPLNAASFPFVPFGNRVERNRFTFEGREYALEPNVGWDRHYLHGDGWRQRWSVLEQRGDEAVIACEFAGQPASPYAYTARQRIYLANGTIHLHLGVTNQGERPLPFGTGHHLFFPLTERTTLEAGARGYVTEKADYMPDRVSNIPSDLDFSGPRVLPRRWINNGFEGWSGRAHIAWPEYDRSVSIVGDASYAHYFLFHSDTAFEPDFADDYFCFEPMTHAAGGLNRPDLGGLVVLAPGKSLKAKLQISPIGFS